MPRPHDPTKSDTATRLFRKAAEHEPLSAKEERQLIPQAQAGDRSAMERLILGNVGFLAKTARHYLRRDRRSVEYDDLMQECVEAFIRAVHDFDPSRGTRLITLLMLDLPRHLTLVKNRAPIVRTLSFANRRKVVEMHHAEEWLTRLFGRAPSRYELAIFLNLTDDQLAELQAAQFPCKSLDQPYRLDEDGDTRGARLRDGNILPSERADIVRSLRRATDLLERAIKKALDTRERDIIRRRFCTLEPISRTDIARKYGISITYTGQIEAAAVKKIALWLEGRNELDALRSYNEVLEHSADLPGYLPLQQALSRLAQTKPKAESRKSKAS